MSYFVKIAEEATEEEEEVVGREEEEGVSGGAGADGHREERDKVKNERRDTT